MPGFVVAGNWKMNKTVQEAKALAADLKVELAGIPGVAHVVCPPFISLSAVAGSAGRLRNNRGCPARAPRGERRFHR